jgi:hypothetical protein
MNRLIPCSVHISCSHCGGAISTHDVLAALRPSGFLQYFWVELDGGERFLIAEKDYNPTVMRLVDVECGGRCLNGQSSGRTDGPTLRRWIVGPTAAPVCNCADWGMTFHLSTCPAAAPLTQTMWTCLTCGTQHAGVNCPACAKRTEESYPDYVWPGEQPPFTRRFGLGSQHYELGGTRTGRWKNVSARMEEKTPQTAAPLGETTGERQTEQTVTGESFNEYWHRTFKALGRGMGLPDNWL